MSRRDFLRHLSATAVSGSLIGANRASTAGEMTQTSIGYFNPPINPLEDRLDRPWEMTEAEWSEVLGRVRPGRRLKPAHWPRSTRFAVAFSFDCDHEVGSLASGNFAPGPLSWGQRGRRVGVPRILDILRRHDVRATFFVPAVVALIDPDETRRIAGDGHEVGLHGWIHANNSKLERATERDIMLRSREILEKVSGQSVAGHRSPNFDMSRYTVELAAELELEYDSSMMADDSCYELLLNGESSGLVEVPVEWARDDAVYLGFSRSGNRPWLSPTDIFDIFKAELEAAAAEGDVFQLLMHPHVIGHRSRVWIIERLIEHARFLGGAWFGTHAEVARWARENAA
ncbi:MAG: polysaccharide deacetylase [Gammaproteobacteria bacterium]|nr:polysaccharide deacetylase [Gammaproteobacteria bacterium]